MEIFTHMQENGTHNSLDFIMTTIWSEALSIERDLIQIK